MEATKQGYGVSLLEQQDHGKSLAHSDSVFRIANEVYNPRTSNHAASKGDNFLQAMMSFCSVI